MDHNPIAYEIKAFADVPAANCSPQPIVDGTEYFVVCPACSGRFEIQHVNGTYRVGIFGRRVTTPPAPIPVLCECGLSHPGRPADETVHGCGAAWRLTQ